MENKVKNRAIVIDQNQKLIFNVNKTDDNSILTSFQEIAKSLLLDYQITVNDSNHYRFTEIEFYLSYPSHPDPYPHLDDRQLEMGQWYFHDSGIDITFGCPDYHGGILIRSIRKSQDGPFFNGPWVVRRELLRHLTYAATGQLSIKVQPIQNNKKGDPVQIYTSLRIGLNPQRDDKNGYKYFNAEYRFVILKEDTTNHCRKAELKPLL